MDDEKKLPEEGTVEDPKEEKKTSGDKNDKKESGYEEYCQMCRRPVSIAGKMMHMPNDLCICNDCLQKTFDSINNNNFPYMELLSLDPSMFRLGDLPKMPKVKKKAKEAEKEKTEQEQTPVLDIKQLKPPHKIKAELDEYVIGQDTAKRSLFP